jgi:glycogen debranching enzyme
MTTALVRPDVLYAWKGPSLLVVNPRGECGDDQGLSGFYYREARCLRTLRLEVNGSSPWLCETAAVAPDRLMLTFVHPEIREPGGGGTGQSGDEEETDDHGIPVRALDIRLSYAVRIASLDVSLTITNRARFPVDVEVAFALGADYADIQEAQTRQREQQAEVEVARRDGILEFAYCHPALPYRTHVHYPAGWSADHEYVRTQLTLASQQVLEGRMRVVPRTGRDDLAEQDVRQRGDAWARWRDGLTSVTVPGNRCLEQALANNIRDIASFTLLEGQPDEWLVPQAGMPLYPAFFGRDAVTAGWQAGMLDRGQSLEAGLTRLGRLQSGRVDDWRDEEPGRIPYQVRTGPLALLNINPYSAYYADYASPLMYVITLANLYGWTGDPQSVRRHWDTARRILDWAREYGDADRDGYLEYATRSSRGTKNQGWKDSGDAIIYDDGRPVPAPIATCELQGYWYVAQQLMAMLCVVMNAQDDAPAYRASAAALKERFNRDWWIDDERFFALALDPDKRPVRALTSNVGHCLACGIIDRDRLPQVVGRLFAPDLFSGWGVRTLSSGHRFYNPLSYHRGTVWAVEQATILFGLRRFGFDARALDLARAFVDLAQLYPEQRIPECVGGYPRGEGPVPGAYPRANTPQLWNATAFPLIVQALLGLVPMAPVDTLVVDPVLPEWIPEIVVSRLRVGRACVTLRFWRDDDGRSRWDVVHKTGTLHILRQPPPESLTAGPGDRITAALESLMP